METDLPKMPGVEMKSTTAGGKYKKIDYEVVDSTMSAEPEEYGAQWRQLKVGISCEN